MSRDELFGLSDEALSAVCRLEFIKATGNGGQKRNKSSSAVRVVLDELGLAAADCTERSQHRNRANALKKLRMEAALKLRVFPAVPPERIDCALTHPDYPQTAARFLDCLEECNYDHRAAAEMMQCTVSALLKKLHRDPVLWQKVNQERTARGLFALRAD